ncbi:MAG: enoyl-CoA hydratase/isomerase family protein [Candidatus Binatia bacterium]|nr:enoyl-CoA hydratase/isomerase family protein [Candidatus Binatia bacterium]
MPDSLVPTTEFLEAELKDRILTIRLNRPDALNAFRPEMLIGIAELAETANAASDVSVIVLEGAGRAFSAGVDLKVLQNETPQAGKIGTVFDDAARRAYLALRRCARPVIAKVHGACFTGALEMARIADMKPLFGSHPT